MIREILIAVSAGIIVFILGFVFAMPVYLEKRIDLLEQENIYQREMTDKLLELGELCADGISRLSELHK